MPQKKVSRKKLLKEPDEFISTTGQIIQFLKTHKRQALRFGVIILALAAAAAGGFYYLRWQEEKALAIQQEAIQLYQEAWMKAMEAPGKENRDSYQKALGKFQEALGVYGWGKTAQVSQIYKGHIHFALKEFEQAVAAYSRCLEGPYRTIALDGLAYCYEVKGDYAKALEHFQKNAQEDYNPYQLGAMLGMARCYEALNQKAKALEAYQKALAKSPQSKLADFIQWKVSELKG